jgi:hypothetical protein
VVRGVEPWSFRGLACPEKKEFSKGCVKALYLVAVVRGVEIQGGEVQRLAWKIG